MNHAASTWIITDGKAGHENQCLGLAAAMGLDPVVKRVTLRQPWAALTPWLRVGLRHATAPPGDLVAPPWPDLVIAAGRPSIAPALDAKRRGRARVVFVQDPRIDPAHFDVVIAPRHDGLAGGNVIPVTGALTRITADTLATARTKWAPVFGAMAAPRVAVLIGGASKVYAFGEDDARALAARLRALADDGAQLIVTMSRRTGARGEAILRAALADTDAWIWDGQGDNPYQGMLAWADAILATGDSVSMASEAASVGVPVGLIELPARGGEAKFAAFRASLYDAGLACPFTGAPPVDIPPPFDETARAARAVWQRLGHGDDPAPDGGAKAGEATRGCE